MSERTNEKLLPQEGLDKPYSSFIENGHIGEAYLTRDSEGNWWWLAFVFEEQSHTLIRDELIQLEHDPTYGVHRDDRDKVNNWFDDQPEFALTS